MKSKVMLNGVLVPITPHEGISSSNLVVYYQDGSQRRVKLGDEKHVAAIDDWLGKTLLGDKLYRFKERLKGVVKYAGLGDDEVSSISFNHKTGDREIHFTYADANHRLLPKHRRLCGSVTTKLAVYDGDVCFMTLAVR